MGRPVRKSGAGAGPAHAHSAHHARHRVRAPVHDLQLPGAGGARLPQHSGVGGGGRRPALGDGPLHERAGVGRLHRCARHCRTKRRGDDQLHRQPARKGALPRGGRADRSDAAPAAHFDDDAHHATRPAAAAGGHRHWCQRAASTGGRGGRRHLHARALDAPAAAHPLRLVQSRGAVRAPDCPGGRGRRWRAA